MVHFAMNPSASRVRLLAKMVALTAAEREHQQRETERAYKGAPELARMKQQRIDELREAADTLNWLADAIDRKNGGGA